MPATIACPKCQTKYQLPDSFLGKPIQCKKCGTKFRTQAPAQGTGGSQSPGTPAKQQPSAEELAQLGIDGPLKRQADIFAGTAPPPPQRGNPLGNFVVEDPGFADVNSARAKAIEESYHDTEDDDDGMASILANPYARNENTIGIAQKDTGFDASQYFVARIGIWMVFVSWIASLAVSIFVFLFGLIGKLAGPKFVASVVETIGPTGILLVVYGSLSILILSMVMIVIGQILCIFSPNTDEKVYAGIAVGSLVLAILLPMFGYFLGGVTVSTTNSNTAQAAVGFVLIAITALSYFLLLSNMFCFISYFRRLGRNTKARHVVDASNLAMMTCIAAIVAGVIGAVASAIIVAIAQPAPGAAPPEWVNNVLGILVMINVILSFSVLATLIGMARSAIEKLR